MSKVSRHEAKQNRAANKQNGIPTQKQSTSNGFTKQVSKQDQPVELKATNSTAKSAQGASKAATSQASKQNVPASKPVTRQAFKFERRQEEKRRRQEEQRRAARRKMNTIIGIVAIVVLLLGGLGYFVYTNYVHPSVGVVPTVVPTPINPNYPAVDNIPCDALEQTAVHYHAHLSIYLGGQLVQIPGNVGIASDGSCFYWMHTHTYSSQGSGEVIHMESPANRTFTLGNFLDIWGQHFSSLGYPAQLDQPGGAGWQIYVNGKPYNGSDFHDIVMKPHLLITLAYNSPGITPDTIYNWGNL